MTPAPLRVAVVGSRGYPRLDLVRTLVASLHTHQATTGRPVVVVSGTEPPPEGVRRVRPDGVDETAIREARRLGLNTVVLPADWNRYGKRAGHLRNARIVEVSDEVWAFHDGVSRGTADTVALARAASLLRRVVLRVVGPDGEPIASEDAEETTDG